MLNQRLDQVTQDSVSAFPTISSLISTIHSGPLYDLSVSPQSKATHGDNLPPIGHAEVHQEDVITSHRKQTVVGQQEDLAEGRENMGTGTTNEVQSVSDMPQDQSNEPLTRQQDKFVDEGATGTTEDESSINSGPQSYQEGSVKSDPSGPKREDDATSSPIHISGIDTAVHVSGSLDSPSNALFFQADISKSLGESTLLSGEV